MPAVIMGALSFRRRNPHRFLMRTCQVSIKEVPSPPQVSIEIELTNKNSLAALFTQSGMLLYCILLLSISESLCLSHGCDWTLAKIQCHNLIWTFCCEEHHFLEAFKWFAFIHLMCLCTACVHVHITWGIRAQLLDNGLQASEKSRPDACFQESFRVNGNGP